MSQEASKEKLELLVNGKLPWEEIKKLLRMTHKQTSRFWQYLDIMQAKVSWKEKILLPLTDHLYIVRKDDGARVVKCDCGHEFGDYRINWKFGCDIYVRKTREEFAEVYTIEPCPIDPDLVEIREYYCPSCAALLAVENVPPGYPPLFDMLPDLDTFYREWLGRPLEDESLDWYQDKTADLLSRWSSEAQA
ncbi:MAG: acetone carboxylase subunit gamma [Chloroflexi bacterium]|nr:MAG: acetone carboxylase subunit gamma [Chloroflexota bacterium]RLC95650.1 MAG: acetone carboxylase subunit gamma [Chloroflexota bacterium]